MIIELVSKNYNEGNRLVNVIEKKLSRLDKYFSGDAEALVKLSTVGTEKYTMEITVRFGGYIARAEVTSQNMYDNIDLVLPKLEKQIAKFRDRMNSKVPKKALPLKAESEESVPAAAEQLGKIVKEKNFNISIVTVEEAIAEMELLDHDFYVFVNADNNKVSVVYTRHDGDYGLITPEYRYATVDFDGFVFHSERNGGYVKPHSGNGVRYLRSIFDDLPRIQERIRRHA